MKNGYGWLMAIITGIIVEQVGPSMPAWQSLLRSLGISLVVLFGMTVLDIASGLCAAYVNSSIDPEVIRRGAVRKSLAFVVVLGVAIVELAALSCAKYNYGKDLDLPLNPTVATTAYYCLAELISILRNASMAGLPLPPFLVDAVNRLSKSTRLRYRKHP